MKIRIRGIASVFFSALLILAVVQADPPAAQAGSFNIYLAGATPGGGGVWDMIGAGLAEAIMKSNPGSVVTVVPGGGVSDIPTVAEGKAELGLSKSPLAAAGLKGQPPFKKKFPTLRAVTSLYASFLQFAVNPNAGIDSIAEIKAKKMPIKLAVGDPGSSGELATRRLLDTYGMGYDVIRSWGGKILFKDMSEAARMYGDGLIDAFTLMTTAPNGPMQQVAASKEIELLPLDKAIVAKMVSAYGYDENTIPKSAYSFLKGGVATISDQVVLVTVADQPVDEIYNVTRGLVQNLDYVHGIHSNLRGLTPKQMASGTGVPLHPGAAKYYKEIGAIQ